MNWTINQTVDLSRGYTPVVWPDALMVSGDVGAHTWRLTVLDNGVPADLSGAAVTGYFVREDRVTVAVAGSVSGNTVSVTLAQNCYAVAGRLGGVLRMEVSGKTVTLSSVIFTVKRLTTDSMVDPGRAFRTVEVLSDLYDALQAQTAALASGSPKGTYATVGDLTSADPDHANIYVVTDDGQWYYWDGSAWAPGGVYQATGLSDGAVSPSKTTFVEDGGNLFDPAAVILDVNLTTGGNTMPSAGYSVSDYIPVTPGTYVTTVARRYALYDGSQALVKYTDVPAYSPQTIEVTVPGFLRLSIKIVDLPDAMVKRGTVMGDYMPFGGGTLKHIVVQDKDLSGDLRAKLATLEPTLWVSKSGSTYKVKFRYSPTENMVVEFAPLGVNAIIHPRRFYRETAAELTRDMAAPTLWHTLSTDWISPYNGVFASEGTLTDFTGTVGGNHGTDGGVGYPTAVNIGHVMYVDGKELPDGALVAGDKAILRVDNNISASNKINPDTGDKSNSLWEKVVYTITPNSIEVMVYLTAREPLTINGYVGLQMTTNILTGGEVYFGDSASKYTPDGVRHNSLPLPFAGDRFVYGAAADVIVTYTNRAVGLGDLSRLGSQPVHYLSSNNKIYSHLVSDPVVLGASDTAHYSGGYTIMPPLVCIGAEKAYMIKVNGEALYCVDFLAPYNRAYLELPAALMGRQVEVVESTPSVTCDDIVGPRGLKLRATGWGSIKVRVR